MGFASENQGIIGTTPVQLTLNNPTTVSRITIMRQGGTASAYYLGSTSSVSSSTGLKVTAYFFEIDLAAGDVLYAVTDSGTVILHTDEES